MKKQIWNILLALLVSLALVYEASAGQIVAWGRNDYGQCDVPAGDDFIAIAAGYENSLALKSNGTTMAWGSCRAGVCNTPEGNDFVAIATGWLHSLALKSDGTIVGWGTNYYGQSDVPEGNDFAAIEAGFLYSVVVKSDGSLFAWGWNGEGECDVPSGNDFVGVQAGGLYNAAIRSNGSLVAWGLCPDRCRVPSGNGFTAFATGTFHGIAVRSDGGLESWGYNKYGECDVPAGNDFVAVEAGRFFSLALKSDGSLVAWGLNEEAPSGRDFTMIASGNYHSLALNSNPSELVAIEIIGLDEVRQNIQTQYEAIAHYADGIKRDATRLANWRVEPNSSAEVQEGLLTTKEIDESHVIVVYAEYTEGGITLEGAIEVYLSLPKTFYVPSQYETIQEAIDEAMNCDSVVLADGVYTGEGNHNVDFLGKSITVRSESGPQNCTIDCEHHGRGFRLKDVQEACATLNGFTIINGNAENGGGIYCDNSNLTVINCAIIGNSARYNGGGIYGRNSRLTISDCTVTANSSMSGGGICCGGSWDGHWGLFTITNCTVTANNSRSGGGIYCGGEGTRYGPGGIFRITNCTISGNSADGQSSSYGGGIYCEDDNIFKLVDCIIAGNTASNGGAIYFKYSNPIISNCTFAENSASNGNALACDSRSQNYPSNLQFNNCIFWNGGNEIWNNDDSTITISYSNVQGAWEGVGNIDADPCFVEAGYWDVDGVWAEGDYRLLSDSPCIDAGDPNYVTEPNETDSDGNPRIIDGDEDNIAVIDMGAYEFWPPIEARMKLTPQTLNCAGKGKFIKAHIILPEDIFPEDVDVNAPAVADPPDIDSEYIKVLGGDTGPVKLEIAFDRRAFCTELTEPGQIEITVFGYLTSGQEFYATDTIRIRAQRPHRRAH